MMVTNKYSSCRLTTGLLRVFIAVLLSTVAVWFSDRYPNNPTHVEYTCAVLRCVKVSLTCTQGRRHPTGHYGTGRSTFGTATARPIRGRTTILYIYLKWT